MKKNTFTKGDLVSAKKWSGEHFLGIYMHSYDDNSHLVKDAKTKREFNVLKGNVKHASEEEEKEIKQLLKNNKTVVEGTEENELDEALTAL